MNRYLIIQNILKIFHINIYINYFLHFTIQLIKRIEKQKIFQDRKNVTQIVLKIARNYHWYKIISIHGYRESSNRVVSPNRVGSRILPAGIPLFSLPRIHSNIYRE